MSPLFTRIIVSLWLCIWANAIANAQELTDTLYLDENLIRTYDKSTAAYLRFTVFNTAIGEELVKTFYITGEKYSEYPVQKNSTTIGYNREWYKSGQLKYEEQIQNNFSIGERRRWYDNGQLYYIYTDLGSRSEATTYYRDGARKRIETFESGKSVQGRCFTKSGQDTTFFPHEENPVFPGGLENMYKYLSKNIRYSKTAYKQKAQGNVILQFIVTKTGHIENIKVVKPLHPDLDKESIRVTAGMPAWEPGKQEGVPVNVRYTLPIRFRL